MNQHYIGKEKDSIVSVEKNLQFENKLFFNDGFDKGKEYVFNKFQRCTFSKISFYKTSITSSIFENTVFIDCYFKHSIIGQTSFENCIFINCGFHNMKIETCKFFYTEWKNTYIKFDTIKNSLPREYGYKKRLCKTMADNCLDDGNMEEYKKFFFEGIKAKENNYKEIILRREDHYKKNYNIYDSFKYAVKFVWSKLMGIVWGYGEKVMNILYSSIVVIGIYAVLYNNSYNITGIDNSLFSNSLFISIASFFNIDSGVIFNDMITKYIGISENILGLVFMGIFVAYLFRSINSRR
ncbi:pentapeptide repeat-containing protein [Clostridium gasigenes]|uniref:pentapeptide repeat-containing protein n=1 Tax=Clostridium gasigenes TaxID=94869 RepID=UPI001C0B0AFE|nr:pentapeptide repeat-containing protein [Clostridium gasigenes]MBU3104410.1 pentapeptide repeat-containing protein [Clostridium gasigenes]MBU3136956.1 pentapeptide repeat-containing protein [Clostridium gasigenes]